MLSLPLPPTTNHLFVNVPGKGRVKSKQYNAWLMEAGHLLNVQRPIKHEGRVEVTIRIPRETRGDLDNRIKGALDLLVRHGVIEDDRFVDGIYISRNNVSMMEIEVTAA